MKANEGTITVKMNELNEVVINDVVSYTPPKNTKVYTDLSKVDIKGYEFSHKEDWECGEIFIYNPKKPNETINNTKPIIMKFKGTKGEWTSKGHTITKSNGEKIRQPRRAGGACMTSMGLEHARLVADAHLIASAPELLEALRNTRQALMNCMSELQTHEQYRDNPDSICIKSGLIACNVSDKAINKALNK